MPDRR